MKKITNKPKLSGAFFLMAIFLFAFSSRAASASIINVDLVPDLDISRFSPYQVQADISDSPTSASVEISGINGDSSGSAWDYYVDGTPASQSRTKTMSYNSGTGKWESQNIYPDDIYPEIFFAPSSVTWNNTPSNISLRRNNYHLLHFNNSFAMAGNMNFFIEINAEPVSTVNSADLAVYLVRKNKNINFFQSDWRNDPDDVELVGSIGKEASVHHTHVAGKSAHHLITLTANADGTVGTRNLDISGDFWIILYSNSPNVNRGWNLKYQQASLCTNSNRWYSGNQAGWTTAAQSGCPDAHIHIARRGANSDGVKTNITALYSGSDPVSKETSFFFEPLPNIPPVPTSFTSPAAGGNYADSFQVSWNLASDPNDDPVTYDIHLLDSSGNEISPALVSATDQTSFSWDISALANGEYGLKGEACDNSNACTAFYLDANFKISKGIPLYSLSGISIASSNRTNNQLAKAGDRVELSFRSSNENLDNLDVEIFSGGYAVKNRVATSRKGTSWKASYVVSKKDEEGTVSFIISADNLDFEYSETTDDSYVTVSGEDSQKARVTSWKAWLYENTKIASCPTRVELEIKGGRFEKNAEVKIGNVKASSVERKSSQKIEAKFCYDKLLKSKADQKRTVKVINPGASEAKASKKIDVLNVKKLFTLAELDMKSPAGIRNIQKALADLGYLDSKNITGKYGPLTASAVKKFQKDNDLEPNGQVGPATRAKLAGKRK